MKYKSVVMPALLASLTITSCSDAGNVFSSKGYNDSTVERDATMMAVSMVSSTPISNSHQDQSFADISGMYLLGYPSSNQSKEITNPSRTDDTYMSDIWEIRGLEKSFIGTPHNIGLIANILPNKLENSIDMDDVAMHNKIITPTITDLVKLIPETDGTLKKGTIAMSSFQQDPQDNNIHKGWLNFTAEYGVSREQVRASRRNQANFNLVRMVARVAVKMTNKNNEGNYDVYDSEYPEKKTGTLRDVTFAVDNLPNSTYLFPQKNSAGNWEGVGEEIPVYENGHIYKNRNINHLTIKREDNADHPYAPKAVISDHGLNKSHYPSVFLMENISRLQQTSTGEQLFWGNVSYVKVYGTYVPDLTNTEVWEYTSEEKKWMKTIRNEFLDYDEKEYNSHPDAYTIVTGYVQEWKKITDNHELKDGTFYIGSKDRLLYANAADAIRSKDDKYPNQKIYTFYKGRMAYRALIQKTPVEAELTTKKPVINCDVIRNSYYILNITKIVGLGFNFDGVNPDDPNLPRYKFNENRPEKKQEESEEHYRDRLREYERRKDNSNFEESTPFDYVNVQTPVNRDKDNKTYLRVRYIAEQWQIVSQEKEINANPEGNSYTIN